MGIIGLQNFMKKSCKNVFEQVMLVEKADLYRNDTGKDPVLILDISSVSITLYNQSLTKPTIKNLLTGFKKFKEDFEEFVNNCIHHGIKLKVVGDGKKPMHKVHCWRNKLMQDIIRLREIYSTYSLQNTTSFFRGLSLHVIFNVLMDKCEYSRAVWEADDDIIEHLKSEECFAVLTNDTDFLMLNNVCYCLSPEGADLHSMIFFNYNRNNLAKFLNIDQTQLPILASLCPSYAFECQDLKNLFRWLRINEYNRFTKVANFIKQFTSEEKLLQKVYTLMNPEEILHFQKRLNFYCGSGSTKAVIPSAYTVRTPWDEIIIMALNRHKTGRADFRIMQIMTDRVYYLSLSAENVLKPLAGDALVMLRKKIYEIIFYEFPFPQICVTEYGAVFSQEESTAVYKERNVEVLRPREMCPHSERFATPHAGLLKLWSPVHPKLEKVEVFCRAINEKLSAEFFCSLDIPEEYVFPLITCFYFLWELDIIEDFEVKTILIQAVMVNNLTWKQIDEYPVHFHMEAFSLIGKYIQVLNHLQLLSSVCGEPFCRYKTNLVNVFDGAIMHYVYGKMKERAHPSTYLDPEIYKIYETLNSKLTKLGRKCGHVQDDVMLRQYNHFGAILTILFTALLFL